MAAQMKAICSLSAVVLSRACCVISCLGVSAREQGGFLSWCTRFDVRLSCSDPALLQGQAQGPESNAASSRQQRVFVCTAHDTLRWGRLLVDIDIVRP